MAHFRNRYAFFFDRLRVPVLCVCGAFFGMAVAIVAFILLCTVYASVDAILSEIVNRYGLP